MLYCYNCGAYYNFNESLVKGSLCECKEGYLFEVDIETENDLYINISLEEITKWT